MDTLASRRHLHQTYAIDVSHLLAQAAQSSRHRHRNLPEFGYRMVQLTRGKDPVSSILQVAALRASTMLPSTSTPNSKRDFYVRWNRLSTSLQDSFLGMSHPRVQPAAARGNRAMSLPWSSFSQRCHRTVVIMNKSFNLPPKQVSCHQTVRKKVFYYESRLVPECCRRHAKNEETHAYYVRRKSPCERTGRPNLVLLHAAFKGHFTLTINDISPGPHSLAVNCPQQYNARSTCSKTHNTAIHMVPFHLH